MTVLLAELKARAVCGCWSFGGAPADIAAVVCAIHDMHIVLPAAQQAQDALAADTRRRWSQPLRSPSPVVRGSARHWQRWKTSLSSSLRPAREGPRPRALHTLALTAEPADVMGQVYGQDPQREMRHPAAYLHQPFAKLLPTPPRPAR